MKIIRLAEAGQGQTEIQPSMFQADSRPVIGQFADIKELPIRGFKTQSLPGCHERIVNRRQRPGVVGIDISEGEDLPVGICMQTLKI